MKRAIAGFICVLVLTSCTAPASSGAVQSGSVVESGTGVSSSSVAESIVDIQASSVVPVASSQQPDSLSGWIEHDLEMGAYNVKITFPPEIEFLDDVVYFGGPESGELGFSVRTTAVTQGIYANEFYVTQQGSAKIGRIYWGEGPLYEKVTDEHYRLATIEGTQDFYLSDEIKPGNFFLRDGYVAFFETDLIYTANYKSTTENMQFEFWIDRENPEKSVELFDKIMATVVIEKE